MANKSITDLTTQAEKVGIGVEADWVKKGTTILEQVNQLLYQYRMIKGIGVEQPPNNPAKNPPSTPALNPAPPIQQPNPPQPATDKGGVIVKQLLEFVNQFLTNCQLQGMGKTSIGEVITKIPLTVDQCLALLMAIQKQQKGDEK